MIIVTQRETLDLSGRSLDQIVASLNDLFQRLYERFEIVQEVLIDGQSFREGYNEFLLNHLDTIKQVEIKTISATEWMRGVVEELCWYLPRLLRACDSISELFYGEMSEEHWAYFQQLTEAIGWVTQSVQALSHHLERTGENADLLAALNGFLADVKEQLGELARELESGDHTAAGDRIKYELPGLFQLLLGRLSSGG